MGKCREKGTDIERETIGRKRERERQKEKKQGIEEWWQTIKYVGFIMLEGCP